jgi:long-chain fatty acid transport protein
MSANTKLGDGNQGEREGGRRCGWGAGLWVGLMLGLLVPFEAGGVGLRLPNQDPEAIARGNAFVATADNPSAIYYNPAGITQLEGQNVQAGMYFLSTGIDYESPTGETARTDSALRPVPQLYYVNSVEGVPVSFGLGVYVPYGLALDWGEANPFRTLVQEGELLYLSVNPVLAWAVHPNLSVAVGPTINYSEASITRGVLVPGDEFKFEGDGLAYGFNAGVRWQPHRKWAFGLSYRSETSVEYEGDAEVELIFPQPASLASSATAGIRFPQHVVVGVSFRPTEDWNFEVNLDWTDWDVLNEIALTGVPGGDQVVVLNYRSSWMYEFGVTRNLGRGYRLSAGYFFSENSSPDRNFTPLVPDSDLHLGSLGLSYRGERWGWAAAYHFGYNPGRTVSGSESGSLVGETGDGTYEILNHAFSLSAAVRF